MTVTNTSSVVFMIALQIPNNSAYYIHAYNNLLVGGSAQGQAPVVRADTRVLGDPHTEQRTPNIQNGFDDFKVDIDVELYASCEDNGGDKAAISVHGKVQ